MKLHLELDIPDEVVDPSTRDEFVAACKEQAVLRLFAERKIPAAVGARLLGLTRIEFMDLTRRRGIPYHVYTAEDFREDMQDLEALERKANQPASRNK